MAWLNYITVIIITTFVVSIITENAVINRLQISEGVQIAGGRCRLLDGYGKLGNSPNSFSGNLSRPMSNNFNNNSHNNTNIEGWEGW